MSSFANAQTSPEILSSALFYPLFIYFALAVFPRRQKALTIPQVTVVATKKHKNKTEEEVVLQKQADNQMPSLKLDADRRMFIKLIASAGLSIFFLSLFTKKAHAAFFGSVPGPGTVAIKDSTGTLIDPAKHHPTDGYKITDLDDSSPAYYGFVDKTGNWFIMKEDSSGAYRYTKGASSYSTNWTGRAGLSYDYFDNVF